MFFHLPATFLDVFGEFIVRPEAGGRCSGGGQDSRAVLQPVARRGYAGPTATRTAGPTLGW